MWKCLKLSPQNQASCLVKDERYASDTRQDCNFRHQTAKTTRMGTASVENRGELRSRSIWYVVFITAL